MMIGSLDIMGGKAVQLQQGDPSRKIYEKEDVQALAKEFSKTGRIAVIDLDAAFGKGNNRELIAGLCRDFEVHVGGGIRDKETAEFYLKAGARKLIIGTKANEEFLSKFHPDYLMVALDMKNQGEVVDEGWTHGSGENYVDRAKRLLPYCSSFLVTQVEKEGMMGGFDMQVLKDLRAITDKQIVAAGGISTEEEIVALAKINVDCQLGMSLYSGKIDLKSCFLAHADWSKGLLPTLVQDDQGQILMVGFSDTESLAATLERGKVCFHSRSRDELWMKGETSGNELIFKTAFWDCDRDTLLFKAEPKGPTCHNGTWTCFGEKDRDLFKTLLGDIKERDENPHSKSWTKKLLADKKLLASKISEEGVEVAEYRDKTNLRWEIADLFYHVGVLMHREDVTLEDVEAELASRRRV
jgi:phosphoribosyl-ATP pyrophosphohydrolase/phosphoribosyl-AMP cyclohydrolase